MLFVKGYYPENFNLFENIASIILFFALIGAFIFGFFIIYKQVALVKKGEFSPLDIIQCIVYGFIFSMALMIVLGMAFIFAVNTESFWEPTALNPNPAPAPEINPAWLIFPLLACLLYISIYPLADFLFVALSEDDDEGLTPFHKFLGKNVILRPKQRPLRIIAAIGLYCVIILPPFLFWAAGFPFIMILVTWLLVYPLMILTFYGSKGWIAGFTNVVIHIQPRSFFLGFENSERVMEEAKDFGNITGPRILLGMMLFVFVWAWISMIQTLNFYFSGQMAISTYSYAGMVFVTLLFGIIGYFTRFWGRKIKYRPIDILFAGYLMAAVGVNVLCNFLIVNPEKLQAAFNYGIIGLHELIPNYLLFAFPAVIEEIVLIVFTSYYLLDRKNEFMRNIKYSKVNESGRTFDPIPLFNFIKSKDPILRKKAEEELQIMYERIPLKQDIDLNQVIYKYPLMDGLCDPNPHSQRICYKILQQLEKDVPEVVLPWIMDALESPNYDKSLPVVKSLLSADISLLEQISEDYIYNLINDLEWHIRLMGLRLLSRLVKRDTSLIINLLQKRHFLQSLINDPNSQVQVEILNILAETEVVLPSDSIISKINHSNKEIRAAAIKNIRNLDIDHVDTNMIGKLIPLMKDPTSSVRASIFHVFAKLGNFQKFFIPILPILEGLTDSNKDVRDASIEALEKYYKEQPDAIDIDVIISKIDPSNDEVLGSVLTFLGRLWDKDPEKILTTLLIFIKFEDENLKQRISEILIEKFDSKPDLIFENLIKIPDVSKFITKGIISKTLITIAKKQPEKVVPKLLKSLESLNEDIKLNAVNSLEGLVDDHLDLIKLKPFLVILQNEQNKQIKKEASKVISKIAKRNPSSIKPVMAVILQSLNQQESSVKIVLSKSLLEIAKETPDLIPIRPIINLLTDEDSFIREIATKILGYVGYKAPEEITDVLINDALLDEEWIVRESAVISLGAIIQHTKEKEVIIKKLVGLLDDQQAWVRRSALNILSEIKELKASQVPFDKISSALTHKDAKVREAAARIVKLFKGNIDRIFDKILLLLEDKEEEVRISMINTMVEIIQEIKLEKILPSLLKQLSDEGSMELQRSVSRILGRTAMYEDPKVKKRVTSLLKIRCEMSQDPIICETLTKLRES